MSLAELKSRCGQGCVPPGGSREHGFPSLSQLLEATAFHGFFEASSMASLSEHRQERSLLLRLMI